MTSLAARLSTLLEETGTSQAALARVCGVKPPSVSDWLSGRTRELTAPHLLRAAAHFNVNPGWLATGAGSKYAQAGQALVANSPLGRYDVPAESRWPFTRVTATRWAALPAALRTRIEGYAEAVVDEWETGRGN